MSWGRLSMAMLAAALFRARSRRSRRGSGAIDREPAGTADSFVSIVKKNADGILVTDREGVVRFANPASARLLGRVREELIGSRIPFRMEPGCTLELRVQHVHGADTDAKVLEVSMGKTDWQGAEACLATLRDATERVRTREALRRNEAKLRRLVDSNITGVAFTDGSDIVREANGAFLQMLGYGREDLSRGDLDWKTLLAPEFRGIHEKAMREVAERGVSSTYEKQCIRKDGGRTWVMGASADLGGGEGSVAFLVDISDRKAAETALRENEEQLRQSQKMEAVGRLAGGVAHDFNNLLTAINGYGDILLAGMDEADARRSHVEEIRKAGEKAAALTRQLLTFSRKQVVVPKILDANAVVSDMVALIRRLIGEDIGLEVKLDPEAWPIRADATQVQQVILNLAINSRDAMSHGGRLTIETSQAELEESKEIRENGVGFHLKAAGGRYVSIMVRDTGSGMDESTLGHLFEPFYSTKEKGKGTGLGLSNVYGIVKQLNGAIRVESAKGRGTSTYIYLPMAAPPHPAEDAGSQIPKQEARPRGRPGGESILLVEDEEAVRKLTSAILSGKGYRVVSAADGREALEYFRLNADSVDLLLTDIVMPGMSGPELADQVRLLKAEARVLFISGYADDERVQKEVSASGAAFLPKPFSPSALLRIVRDTLDTEAVVPHTGR